MQAVSNRRMRDIAWFAFNGQKGAKEKNEEKGERCDVNIWEEKESVLEDSTTKISCRPITSFKSRILLLVLLI